MPTEEEKKLIKAFNIGYTLNQYEPKLLDKITEANPDSELIQILKAGQRQQEKDKLIAEQKEMLSRQTTHKPKR